MGGFFLHVLRRQKSVSSFPIHLLRPKTTRL